MDLTRENLSELFKGFNASFAAGMQRGRQFPAELAKYRIKLRELALVVPSSHKIEIHAWMNQLPGFTEWVGERTASTLNFDNVKVTNRKFHQTVDVLSDDIEDDTFGVYGPLFEGLGAEAQEEAFWLDLAIEALLDTGKWADAAAFFGTTRKYEGGANAISNLAAEALDMDAVILLWGQMMAFKGGKDKALAPVPTFLLTGPDLFPLAKTLCEAERISDDQNEARGLLAPRFHEAITAGTWFVCGTGKGGTKGVAVQQRRQGNVLVRKDRAEDDNVFFQGKAVYGSDARGEGFKTLPHLLIKSVTPA